MNPLYPDCTNINTKNQFKNYNKTKKQHFHIISLKATQSLPYKETLHRLVHDERFLDVPKILETPWVAVEGTDKKEPPYKEEIAWLLEK